MPLVNFLSLRRLAIIHDMTEQDELLPVHEWNPQYLVYIDTLDIIHYEMSWSSVSSAMSYHPCCAIVLRANHVGGG